MGCCLKKKQQGQKDNSEKDEPFLSSNEEGNQEFTTKVVRGDFDEMKVLGKGSFGKVLLVRYKKNQKLYAMKILKKAVIMKNNEEIHTKTERKILAKINHPFIVSLYFAFQDEKKLYLITEFMQGGELFYHLHRERFFSNERTQFYAAEIVLALDHLHKNNCIYRDLKPENVLLDKDGHIKLADFGLSKIMLEKNKAKAFTLCGTPDYLAPEILEDKGYDKTVDWWSLGALIYEMLVGYSPFKMKKGEQLNIEKYKEPVPLHNHFTPEAKMIITDLLVVEPSKRLGYGSNGTENIKKHPFFKDINWEELYNKKVEPEFVPKIFNELDLGNFDKFFTNENVFEPESEMNSASVLKDNPNEFAGFTYVKPGVVDEAQKDDEDI